LGSFVCGMTRTEYYAKWRKDNPNYFKTYYKKHKKKVQESTTRYRKSKEGKAKIKAYEQTKERKESKKQYSTKYQQSLIVRLRAVTKERDTLLSLNAEMKRGSKR